MFEDLTDGELIDLHKKGDIDAFPALFDRYRQMIRGLSSSYFLVGGDRDDLMQEGMLGLLKAVNTYNPEAGTAFSTFAHLCIESGMKTAVKRSLSAGNYPLNVSSDLSEEGDKLVSEIDPEKTVIGKEDEEEFDRNNKSGARRKPQAAISGKLWHIWHYTEDFARAAFAG